MSKGPASEVHCLSAFRVCVITNLLFPVTQTTGRIVVFIKFFKWAPKNPWLVIMAMISWRLSTDSLFTWFNIVLSTSGKNPPATLQVLSLSHLFCHTLSMWEVINCLIFSLLIGSHGSHACVKVMVLLFARALTSSLATVPSWALTHSMAIFILPFSTSIRFLICKTSPLVMVLDVSDCIADLESDRARTSRHCWPFVLS